MPINSKSGRVTVPHTHLGHSPANPYNSGPSQDISFERGSVLLCSHNNYLSSILTRLRMTTTLYQTSSQFSNPFRLNSTNTLKSSRNATLTSYQTTDNNHNIPLEGDLRPFGPIYSLSAVELKALDEPKGEPREGIRPSQFQPGGFIHPLCQETRRFTPPLCRRLK